MSVADGNEGLSYDLPLEGLIDIEAEQARLQKELDDIEGYIKGKESQLANQGFVNNAPEHVVQGVRDSLAELVSRREAIQTRLSSFGS